MRDINLDTMRRVVHGVDGFDVTEREGVSIVRYLHSGAFYDAMSIMDEPDPLLLETRFAHFDSSTGECLVRPFEKFFNYGEPALEWFHGEIDQDLNNWVAAIKEDGSLITIRYDDDEGIVVSTKSGESEVATLCRVWMKDWLEDSHIEIFKRYSKDITFLFEFCSPNSRIVLNYEDTSLRVLGARRIEDGEYLDTKTLESIMQPLISSGMVHMVRECPAKEVVDVDTLDEFAKAVYDMDGIEGYVLRHVNDGLRVKVKTKYYLDRHGAVGTRFSILRSLHSNKRRFIEAMTSEWVDDMLSALDGDTKQIVLGALEKFNRWLHEQVDYHVDIAKQADSMSRREFAIELRQKCSFGLDGLIFGAYGRGVNPSDEVNEKARDQIVESILKMNMDDVNDLLSFLNDK